MNKIKIGDIIKFGEYTWRVLDVRENMVLIITEDIVEERRFDPLSNDWENSEIKKYLNDEFYNKFSNECKSRIDGVIFLLSIEEAEKYFCNDSDRMAKYIYSEDMKKYGDDTWWWWLRECGDYSNVIAGIDNDGSVTSGSVIYNNHGGVRPALWVKL
jgi:hypothetical protein